MQCLCLQTKWLHRSHVGSCIILGSTIPKNPTRYVLIVFDSAAEINAISLNKLLLSGPYFTNSGSLLGVLFRFRQNPTAFMADIEQMFHPFVIKEIHRDLRFQWYKGNDTDEEVIEYRMKVHLFGNTVCRHQKLPRSA